MLSSKFSMDLTRARLRRQDDKIQYSNKKIVKASRTEKLQQMFMPASFQSSFPFVYAFIVHSVYIEGP